MELRFYNALTRTQDVFEPIEAGRVSMYNCGPTVYDFAHIGNFKTFLFADVLRRFLEAVGYDVEQVMNLTDVGHMTDDAIADGGGEDKMAAAGKRLLEAKKSGDAHAAAIADPNDPYAVAAFYIDAFVADARSLGLRVAADDAGRRPRATDHVPQMIAMIERLVQRGHAYVAGDGAVYYDVQSFPDYGRLSGNSLDELRGGAGGRVSDTDQAAKRHPADFLLWKPDATHLMSWDAPWGRGYPGWHIECSAMATHVLGRDVIDIHTGGEDNIFPHHECEIAQTCGATGNDRFARLWMHSRHLMVEGQKMSKSKGNFFTVRQILAGDFTGRPVDPAVLRFELIRANYRSRMDFTRKGLQDSGSAVRKLRTLRDRLEERAGAAAVPEAADDPAVHSFHACLADDLNTAGAIGVAFEWVKELDAEACDAAAALATLQAFDRVLGVLTSDTDAGAPLAGAADGFDPVARCRDLDAARAAKDFATADAIRDALQDAGYTVKTTPAGTVAERDLA